MQLAAQSSASPNRSRDALRFIVSVRAASLAGSSACGSCEPLPMLVGYELRPGARLPTANCFGSDLKGPLGSFLSNEVSQQLPFWKLRI